MFLNKYLLNSTRLYVATQRLEKSNIRQLSSIEVFPLNINSYYAL